MASHYYLVTMRDGARPGHRDPDLPLPAGSVSALGGGPVATNILKINAPVTHLNAVELHPLISPTLFNECVRLGLDYDDVTERWEVDTVPVPVPPDPQFAGG